jgi:hypothetical protein
MDTLQPDILRHEVTYCAVDSLARAGLTRVPAWYTLQKLRSKRALPSDATAWLADKGGVPYATERWRLSQARGAKPTWTF